MDFIEFTQSGVNIESADKVKLIGKTMACSKRFPPDGNFIINEYPQY